VTRNIDKRATQLMVKRYGEDAPIQAAVRAAELFEAGCLMDRT